MFNQVKFLDPDCEPKPIDTNTRYLGVSHDHLHPNRTDYSRRTLLTDLVLACALHHWSTGALEHWSTGAPLCFTRRSLELCVSRESQHFLYCPTFTPPATRGEKLGTITTSWVTDSLTGLLHGLLKG